MKKGYIILIMLASLFVINLLTMPDDGDCITMVRNHMHQDALSSMIEVNRFTVEVEHGLLCKTIVSKADGSVIGWGVFGTVIFN